MIPPNQNIHKIIQDGRLPFSRTRMFSLRTVPEPMPIFKLMLIKTLHVAFLVLLKNARELVSELQE
jgi:hypothetical protein